MIPLLRRLSIYNRIIGWSLLLVLLPGIVHYLALFLPAPSPARFWGFTLVLLFMALVGAAVVSYSLVAPIKPWVRVLETVEKFGEYDFIPGDERDEFVQLEEAWSRRREELSHRPTPSIAEDPNRVSEKEQLVQEVARQQQAIKRFSQFLEISNHLLINLDMGHNLRRLLTQLNQFLNLEWSSVFVKDLDKNGFRLLSLIGKEKRIEEELNNAELIHLPFSLNEGIAGKVFQERKPYLVNRGYRSPDFVKFPQSQKYDEKIFNFLCLPLIHEGEIFGVINCINRQNPPLFQGEDIEFAEGIASLVAFEIYRHEILREVLSEELSGLLSKSYWFHCFENEKNRARRFKQNCSLVAIDIENFRQLNEKYDYDFGDTVIRAVSTIIKGGIRSIDFARRQGGKFFIVIPETPADGAVYFASRILEEMDKLELLLHGQKIKITLSIGVATFPAPVERVDELENAALTAVKTARKLGGNRVYSFVP